MNKAPEIIINKCVLGNDEWFVNLLPTQPHQDAVRQMKNAQVLLLCIFEQTKFVLTGKLFEYLASERPIFCVGPIDGDAAMILQEAGAGSTFSFENKTAIKQHLIDLYAKFKRGELKQLKNDSQKYSHKELVKKIVIQLNQISKK